MQVISLANNPMIANKKNITQIQFPVKPVNLYLVDKMSNPRSNDLDETLGPNKDLFVFGSGTTFVLPLCTVLSLNSICPGDRSRGTTLI